MEQLVSRGWWMLHYWKFLRLDSHLSRMVEGLLLESGFGLEDLQDFSDLIILSSVQSSGHQHIVFLGKH